MIKNTLISTIDKSINIINTKQNGAIFESRFVQRVEDYFIIYLSSQSGCEQACRMCHLTATGQNKNVQDASVSDFIIQASDALRTYCDNTASKVHFNFMARGEPLLNKILQSDPDSVLLNLQEMATARNLSPEFLISSIMPKSRPQTLLQQFDTKITPRIYYSLYSVNPSFRKKWLPKADDYNTSLVELMEYQTANPEVKNKIHFAFIKGQNDSDVEDLSKVLRSYNYNGMEINIVRYNPFSDKYGKESTEDIINHNVEIIQSYLPESKIKIIPPVGKDVFASCGMFTK